VSRKYFIATRAAGSCDTATKHRAAGFPESTTPFVAICCGVDGSATTGRGTTTPASSAFISEDPVEFAGGDPNLYAYVHNAPLTFRDPLGLRVDLSLSSPEVNRALDLVKRTKRGRELYETMERDPRTCHIVSLSGFQNAVRVGGTCDIVIDPEFHPEIPTLAGRKSASTARILAHEMGHAATGVGDTGPGQMDNIILNENPVASELGLSPRTGYAVPWWWYLPLIGHPAPSGVEVPRR
jgi:hypothetical protein